MALAPMILKLVCVPSLLTFLGAHRNNLITQPLPFPGVNKIRAAKKVVDRIGNQLITERKSALVQEQSYGVKEKSNTTEKDLLTLLVRANLQDADGMSDSDVRARKGSHHVLSAPLHGNPRFFQRSVPSL